MTIVKDVNVTEIQNGFLVRDFSASEKSSNLRCYDDLNYLIKSEILCIVSSDIRHAFDGEKNKNRDTLRVKITIE